MKYYFLADVDVKGGSPISEVASLLTEILDGFIFTEDIDGRFEEVPAMVARIDNIEFILFGEPDNPCPDSYFLQMQCREGMALDDLTDYQDKTGIDLGSILKSGLEDFVRTGQDPLNSYIKVSQQIVDLINTKSTIQCQVAQ